MYMCDLQLEEFYVENNLQQPWGPGEQSGAYSQQHPDQTHGFFQPLECDSTLHIGYVNLKRLLIEIERILILYMHACSICVCIYTYISDSRTIAQWSKG